MSEIRLVVFTRYPEAGKAKTRLIPAIGGEGAADLHRRLTERTLAAARASGLRVEVRITGGSTERFANWLGGDLSYVDQGAGDLGARMMEATHPSPVLFIGSDLPDLKAEHLKEAAGHLAVGRHVIGPADDGGYWALGLPQPCDALFRDMPWSTDEVFGLTIARLRQLGITPVLLPTLADCDRQEDLVRWPELRTPSTDGAAASSDSAPRPRIG